MIAPSTIKPVPAPAAEPQTLPQVIITGKRDPQDEMREVLREILKEGPALVDQMSPEDLEIYRQTMHDAMIGGGSAKTLVEMAEMISEGSKLVKEEQAKDPTIDLDADMEEGVPITNGQMPQFTDLIKRLTCRTADQQLKKETAADEATVAQTANSPEGAAPAKHLKEDRELRKRLDLACTP